MPPGLFLARRSARCGKDDRIADQKGATDVERNVSYRDILSAATARGAPPITGTSVGSRRNNQASLLPRQIDAIRVGRSAPRPIDRAAVLAGERLGGAVVPVCSAVVLANKAVVLVNLRLAGEGAGVPHSVNPVLQAFCLRENAAQVVHVGIVFGNGMPVDELLAPAVLRRAARATSHAKSEQHGQEDGNQSPRLQSRTTLRIRRHRNARPSYRNDN